MIPPPMKCMAVRADETKDSEFKDIVVVRAVQVAIYIAVDMVRLQTAETTMVRYSGRENASSGLDLVAH